MISREFTYKNITLSDIDIKYHITRTVGLDTPGIRETREDKAGMDGQVDYQTFLGERLVILEGELGVIDSDSKEEAIWDLKDNFVVGNSYDWLKFEPKGKPAMQLYCKCIAVDIDDDVSKDLNTFSIGLVAIDPRIYSQTENTVTIYIPTSEGGRIYPKSYPKSYGTARIGGSANCINSGNFSTLPLVRMYGPLTNPQIKNYSDNNKYVKINITIPAENYIEIDFANHTVMLCSVILDGTPASRYGYLDSGSEFFELVKGNNDIEFRDDSGNVSAYCKVIYRSAWI